jgi:signal transduction histidine kinase
VHFALRECGEDVAVRVDRWRLMQVLSNLLSNAAKYAPRDSVVEVSTCVHERLVRVAVKDSGPGIPEAFHDGVFQRFSQADSSDSRQKGGTGLGLAITKELVEHMGGRVGFESTPGAGATFYFDLPIVGSSAETGDTTTSPDTTHGSTGNP